MYPCSYKGLGNNIDEGISLTGFPQFAYATDAFMAWLSQQGMELLGGFTKSAVSSIASAATLNPYVGTAAVMDASRTVGNFMSEGFKASIAPPKYHGGSRSNSVYLANGKTDFFLFRKHIRIEFARMIDDYFDRFGYACHQNKVPNRHSRNSWTFTKTVGCTITGSIPRDDEDKICSCYNKGITFWSFDATVGDYTQNNEPFTT